MKFMQFQDDFVVCLEIFS